LFSLNQTFKRKIITLQFIGPTTNDSTISIKNAIIGNITISAVQKELQNSINNGYNTAIQKLKKEKK